ncbi:MAG TPA: YgdI/YgdR family lipoprotein [Verrucomicrobium sp.]|nr:YgdI/YgdR family lipoprotein [Verrucomicrobium sp.]
MKHSLVLVLILAGTLCVTGCGSSPYKITLRDGREYLTASRPEFNEKTGYYKFRSQNDRDSLIRSDEILMMQEL